MVQSASLAGDNGLRWSTISPIVSATDSLIAPLWCSENKPEVCWT